MFGNEILVAQDLAVFHAISGPMDHWRWIAAPSASSTAYSGGGRTAPVILTSAGGKDQADSKNQNQGF